MIKSILVLTLLTLSPSLFATPRLGGISDGGGNAVVCRNQSGEITSAEVLDLYEAKNMYARMPQVDSTLDHLSIALLVADRINKGDYHSAQTGIVTTKKFGEPEVRYFSMPREKREPFLGSLVEQIHRGMIILPPGVALNPVEDFDLTIIPKDCKIEQAAIYRDSNSQIYVVGDIWEKLDSVNKAALLLHEAVYLMLRWEGETSSNRTRVAVGLGFANYAFPSVLEGVPKTRVMTCNSKDKYLDWRIIVYQSGSDRAILQILRLDGFAALDQTHVQVSLVASPLPSGPSDNSSEGRMYKLISPNFDYSRIGFFTRFHKDGSKSHRIGLVGHTFDENLLVDLYCRNPEDVL